MRRIIYWFWKIFNPKKYKEEQRRRYEEWKKLAEKHAEDVQRKYGNPNFEWWLTKYIDNQ